MEDYPINHPHSSLTAPVLSKYAQPCFIETGSNTGCGVAIALRCGISEIHSIEYLPKFFDACVKRYSSNRNVHLYLGSSGDVLLTLVPTLTQRSVFYLDAHGYYFNPLLDELKAIALSPIKDHTIMIDDVRMFGSAVWNNIQQEQAMDLLMQINPNYKIAYEDSVDFTRDILVAYID